MKRILVLFAVASCTPRPSFQTDAGAPARVSCETTSTCSLACDDASAWVTSTCADEVSPSTCVDSFDREQAYGCALECGRSARVVASCDDTRSR